MEVTKFNTMHMRGPGSFVSVSFLGSYASRKLVHIALSYLFPALSYLSPFHLFIPPQPKSLVGCGVGEKADKNGTGESSSQTVQVPVFCLGQASPTYLLPWEIS